MCQASKFKAQQLPFPHAYKVNTDTQPSPVALGQEFSIFIEHVFLFCFWVCLTFYITKDKFY